MVVRAFAAAFFALILAGAGMARADEPLKSYFFNTLEEPEKPQSVDNPLAPPAPAMQTPEAAQAKSAGCMSCHTETDSVTMHTSPGVNLGCADCHGGDAGVTRSNVVLAGSDEYRSLEASAHLLPRYPKTWGWPSSSKPVRSYTLLNREDPEFIR